MTDDLALFDAAPYVVVPTVEATPNLSATRRRTIRQAAMVRAGGHPLAAVWPVRLHPGAGRNAAATDGARLPLRCGTCWYRRTVSVGNRTVAKCFAEGSNPTDLDRHAGGFPRLTHSEASDVRSWWPACTEYSGGDNGTSDDAARWTPQAVSV